MLDNLNPDQVRKLDSLVSEGVRIHEKIKLERDGLNEAIKALAEEFDAAVLSGDDQRAGKWEGFALDDSIYDSIGRVEAMSACVAASFGRGCLHPNVPSWLQTLPPNS